MNIGYFRVSKEDETIQDLDVHIRKVKEMFGVEFDKIYKERASAYDLSKISKRTEFFRMLRDIFPASRLEEIFTAKPRNQEIKLFVWDFDRIMRNLTLNLYFIILCDVFNVTIYSYKDGKTQKKHDETPSETFARYMLNSVHAFAGQQYSYTISTNVRKNVVSGTGVTRSTNNQKWGRYFNATEDNEEKDNNGRVKLDVETADKLFKDIKRMLNVGKRQKEIQDRVARKYKIKVSNSYISKIKVSSW